MPSVFSPGSKDRRSNIHTEKINLKPSYEIWMKLVQRLHDRTLSSIEDQHSTRQEKISPWNNEELNSNKQVITLINHYSSMLATDNNEKGTLTFNDRPKSILRSRGTMNKNRFTKEVTFAID